MAKYFNKSVNKGSTDNQNKEQTNQQTVDTEVLKQTAVSLILKDNYDLLKKTLGQNDDIVFRSFCLGMDEGYPALIIYIENMVDKTMLNNNILKPLMFESMDSNLKPTGKSLYEVIINSVLAVSNVVKVQKMDEVVADILAGGVILVVEGLNQAFVIDIRQHMQRSITEPENEVLVRGPREGFVEDLRSNLVLIRRHIKSPNLIFDNMKIGRITATDVSVSHIKGLASPDLVNEVKQRLQHIDIDGVLESGYLEELIEDSPYSPFPQILHTERPDRVAAALLEGRVAILTDGSPFVLIVPAEMNSFITSPEDYYERYYLGTLIIWIRLLSFAISLVLPSLYIAITTFHSEMIPTRLLISITSYRQGLPFPTLMEALMMELTFEILREAGVRLPRSIGQAVSIVGALVIGQSAVQAGIVSPLMVIIVAFTGIASFTFSSYALGIAIRILRFPLMILAGFLGLFGVMIGIIMISVHLASLRSLGIPYLSPVAPLHLRDFKDVFLRVPWWKMDERPTEVSRINRRRQVPNLKPVPPKAEQDEKKVEK